MAHRNTLRHTIVQSDLTFVMSLLLTTCVWLHHHWSDNNFWLTYILLAVTSYILLETNTRCHLLRVRSRMVSSTYLILLTSLPALHSTPSVFVAPLCMTFANLLLFSRFEDSKASGTVFYAFLLIGIALLMFPPLVLLLPAVWFCSSFHLRVLTPRAWMASLMGLALPHLYYITYALYAHTYTPTHWTQYLATPSWTIPEVPVCIHVGMFILLFAWSTIHFRSNSYRDTMRTRMFFSVFLGESLFILPLFIVCSDQWQQVTALHVALAAPLIAHYFALAEGKWHNFWCFFWAGIVLTLAILNYAHLWTALPFPLNF